MFPQNGIDTWTYFWVIVFIIVVGGILWLIAAKTRRPYTY
jgi:hypothetical protein